jgi:nicotinamidase-related amidase
MDALMVIDVQLGMFAIPGYQPWDGVGVVARIRGLLDRARDRGTPIYFIQHDGGAGHPLAAGSEGFPFRPELQPLPSEAVIVKRNCSAFQDTGLDAELRAAGVDHLIICGMQTEYCVDTTVRSAFERGFRVTLAADGHTTFDTPALEAEAIVAHHNQTMGGSFAAVEKAAAIRFANRHL